MKKAPVELFRTVWGVPFLDDVSSWPSFFSSLRRDGFTGLECCSPGPFFPFGKDPSLFKQLLSEHHMQLIMQVHTLDYPVVSHTAQEHMESLEQKVH